MSEFLRRARRIARRIGKTRFGSENDPARRTAAVLHPAEGPQGPRAQGLETGGGAGAFRKRVHSRRARPPVGKVHFKMQAAPRGSL